MRDSSLKAELARFKLGKPVTCSCAELTASELAASNVAVARPSHRNCVPAKRLMMRSASGKHWKQTADIPSCSARITDAWAVASAEPSGRRGWSPERTPKHMLTMSTRGR